MHDSRAEITNLLSRASEARNLAYAPYSGFAVGAALLSDSGEIFCGCNVENLSLGLTICAERVAVASAVQAGQRRFELIAIIGSGEGPIIPCGACRQVLAEFAPDIHIVSEGPKGVQQEWELSDLLPCPGKGILGR